MQRLKTTRGRFLATLGPFSGYAAAQNGPRKGPLPPWFRFREIAFSFFRKNRRSGEAPYAAIGFSRLLNPGNRLKSQLSPRASAVGKIGIFSPPLISCHFWLYFGPQKLTMGRRNGISPLGFRNFQNNSYSLELRAFSLAPILGSHFGAEFPTYFGPLRGQKWRASAG